MKIEKEEAYLAVKTKWEYLVENPTADPNDVESLEYSKGRYIGSLNYNCGYCELFREGEGDDDHIHIDDCENCPLVIEDKLTGAKLTCPSKKHPFSKWYYSKTSENAQELLDLIIETKHKLEL